MRVPVVTSGDVASLVELLAVADQDGALAHVLALADQVGTEEVVVRLLTPALAEVGRRWEGNEWTAGQQHAADGVVETVLAVLSSRLSQAPDAIKVVVACARNDRHTLPARMAALLLRVRGWGPTFVGATLPAYELERYLGDGRPHALVLSCSLPLFLPGAAAAVVAAHAAGVPVLAGGRAFGADDLRARRLGAEGWAPTLADAADVLASWFPPPPLSVLRPPDDAELADLRLHRQQVLDATVDLVAARLPGLARGPSWWAEHTRSEAMAVLATLEAALLLDDERILLEHARWLVPVSTCRGLPHELVPVSLGAVAAATRVTARARRMLQEAEVEAAAAVAELERARVGAAGPRPSGGVAPPRHPDEAGRLRALRELRALDSSPDPALDELAHVAAAVCQAPAALVCLVDEHREQVRAGWGISFRETPRDRSFSSWTILQGDVHVVPDTLADSRFADHPLVGPPEAIRFYAGVPVVVNGGHPVGALCVLDRVPRHLTGDQRQALRALAGYVGGALELAAARVEMADAARQDGPGAGHDGDRGVDGDRAGAGGGHRREGASRRQDLLRRILGEDQRGSEGSARLLRTRDVARLFDVSERTVNYWASRGRLPYRRTAGGHRRYDAEDLLGLLDASSTDPFEG